MVKSKRIEEEKFPMVEVKGLILERRSLREYFKLKGEGKE